MWGAVTLAQINYEHARQAAKGAVDSRKVYQNVGIKSGTAGADTVKDTVKADEPVVVGEGADVVAELFKA